MQQKPYYFQMEVKATTQDNNGKKVVRIKGFASTPDVDRYGDVVEPTAFKDALTLFMKNPVVLYQHDDTRPVGTITSAVITEKGLSVEADIMEDDSQEKVLDGRMRAFSFGWIPLDTEFRHKDGSAFNNTMDSIWDPDIVRVIKALDLVEISIVTTPANGNALFTVAKSVKSFFSDAATKSMPMKNKKDASETTQEAAQTAPEVKPVETQEPVKTEEAKTEEVVPAETVAPVETAPKEAPVTPVAPAGEATTTTPTNGDKPPEADEKGDEKAPADSPEAPKGEEGKAESKPEAATEGKALIVSKSVSDVLPELVQAGLLTESKEAGKGLDLPKEIVGLMRKMADAYIESAKQVKELEEKLAKLPVKSALKVHGQYEAPKVESAKKEVGRAFKGLFGGQI